MPYLCGFPKAIFMCASEELLGACFAGCHYIYVTNSEACSPIFSVKKMDTLVPPDFSYYKSVGSVGRHWCLPCDGLALRCTVLLKTTTEM